MVKHKSKYSCESTIYFNLNSKIIKENWNFAYYFVTTNIKPEVFDGGNEIILPNWPKDKHIECDIINDIPVGISSFPYVLLNRSLLYNCGIEAENHFVLKSLAAGEESESKLLNLNYFNNLTRSIELPVLLNRMTYKQILLISLKTSYF